MIRVARGAEPGELPGIRDERVRLAARHFVAGTLDRKKHITGYDVAKEPLRRAQSFKCGYCERNNLEASHQDVEHFRPAMRADRGPGHPTHGYWWLAWTWENLLFSCKSCNNAKRDRFPLVPGSPVLRMLQTLPCRERAMLVDPSIEDPMNHIRFARALLLGRMRWSAQPRRGSRRGAVTIEVLRLNREGLLDLYEWHVERLVDPVVRRIHQEMRKCNATRVRQLWVEQVLPSVAAGAPFSALSHDAFDQLVSRVDRGRWGLRFAPP